MRGRLLALIVLLIGLSGPAAGQAMAQGGTAQGGRHTQERWGVSFVIPSQWFVTDRAVAVLVASNTEPGLVILRFLRKTGLEKLREGYAEGMEEEGLRLMPVVQLQDFSAGNLKGLAGEMAGRSNDGYMVRARTIGVVSPYGDAAVVLGLTTEDRYPQLKAHTDALAASIAFTKPLVSPVRDFLAGQYWAYSGSSTYSGSYSREARLALCADGTFSTNRETFSSGTEGTVGAHGRGGGQWTAEGDELQGVVILTYGDGRQTQLEYVTSPDPKDRSGYGPAVTFSGTKYQKAGDGSCSR